MTDEINLTAEAEVVDVEVQSTDDDKTTIEVTLSVNLEDPKADPSGVGGVGEKEMTE